MSNIHAEFNRKTSRDEQVEFLVDKIAELGEKLDAVLNGAVKPWPATAEPEAAKTDAPTA
jgi:hypothetical protein